MRQCRVLRRVRCGSVLSYSTAPAQKRGTKVPMMRRRRLIYYHNKCDNKKITFTSPMSEANLKGCHAVQNLGAVETYIKRYLYQNCFEIVESDILDETMNPNEKTNKTNGADVDEMIKRVQERMNTFNDAQLDYANKAIKQRNVSMLKNCLK